MPSDISRTFRRALLIAAAVEIPLVVAFYVLGMPLETPPGVARLMIWLCQFPGILLLDPIGGTWPSTTGDILRPSLTQMLALATVNGGVIAVITYTALRLRTVVRRSPPVVSHA